MPRAAVPSLNPSNRLPASKGMAATEGPRSQACDLQLRRVSGRRAPAPPRGL